MYTTSPHSQKELRFGYVKLTRIGQPLSSLGREAIESTQPCSCHVKCPMTPVRGHFKCQARKGQPLSTVTAQRAQGVTAHRAEELAYSQTVLKIGYVCTRMGQPLSSLGREAIESTQPCSCHLKCPLLTSSRVPGL